MSILNKRYKVLIFTSAFAAFTAQATPIFITPKAPDINAVAYALVDYNSNKIIAANHEHKKHPPASLTKLMTAYVVFQLLKDGRINLTDSVKISENAWKTGGSKSFIEVGKSVKLEILLKGMIVQSGNDAAVALAEHIAGSENTFAAYMNQYADQLGMQNTHFENASGLPSDNQYTTAADTAILAAATIRDFPQLYPWYKQKYFTYNEIKQRNRNKLLWTDSSVDGLKTGFTKKAGYSLVTSAKRLDMRLISVVLGSSSANARTQQTQKILDYGFRYFESVSIADVNESVPIKKSTKGTLKIGLSTTAHLLLERGKFRVTKQTIALNSALVAPINKGDIVGNLIISFEDEILTKLPLIALENGPQAGFISRMIDNIKSLF